MNIDYQVESRISSSRHASYCLDSYKKELAIEISGLVGFWRYYE